MAKQKKDIKANKKPIGGNDLLFDKLERWMNIREKGIQWILFAVCLTFSFLLFNYRISEGNDDALYIESGYKYANDFFHYYYTANAPFYPMFIGLVIAVIGIKLFWLKLFSVAFNFLALLFFYKSFKNRMPNALLLPILFTIAVNSYFQYFASQTYTEAFFLFIEGLFFFYFFKLLDTLQTEEDVTLKSNLKTWLTVGFFTFFLTMTRNVAAVVVLAILVYFLLQKKWRYAIYGLLAYLVFKIPFEIIKFLIWGSNNQYGSQSGLLMQKDPYNASKGTEDLMGFVARFFDNCSAYLSRRFLQILGFMSENQDTNIGIFAFVIIVIFMVGLIYAFRTKNNYLLFASLHTFFLAGATFIVLQQRWDQPRMIMIHVPVLLIMIYYGIYHLSRKSGFGQSLLGFLVTLVFLSSCISSIRKASENIPILKKNLEGDKYYGYTPDWRNFLQMSEWCADNLSDSALVASRKAPMSFVYGKGKEFFPVYKVVALDTTSGYSNPDSVLLYFRKNKVTHVILPSLRRDPAKADGNVINTLHRMMEPIAKKYPERIKLVHQIPAATEAQIEPAYLYEVRTK